MILITYLKQLKVTAKLFLLCIVNYRVGYLGRTLIRLRDSFFQGAVWSGEF